MRKAKADPLARSADADSDLVLAAYFGDEAHVARALHAGASPDARQAKTDQSALMLAVANGHAGTVRLLLARGADPRTATRVAVRGRTTTVTALGRAKAEGKYAIVALLEAAIARLPRSTVRRPELNPDLAQAIEFGEDGRVRALLAAGADANGKTPLGEAMLAWATRLQYANVGRTSAELAQRAAILKCLLDAGADPQVADPELGLVFHDVLTFAAANVVPLFLAAGADVRARGPDGRTAASCLASRRARGDCADVLPMLVARGFDVNAQAVADRSLLVEGLRARDARFVATLLAQGADVQRRGPNDEACWEPLAFFSDALDVRLLALLLAHGLDPNTRSRGRSLSHAMLSVSGCNLEGLRLVLEARADPEAVENGRTLLGYAAYVPKKVRAEATQLVAAFVARKASRGALLRVFAARVLRGDDSR